VFGRCAPVVLEIGFGTGEATAALAAADPGRDVLAVDVHTPGVANLLRLLDAGGLGNVRVAEGDALVLLRDMIGPGALDEVRVLFPDPWPKSRHHKRRLVTPPFAALVVSRLRPGGRLHVATDWPHYAEQVLAVVATEPSLAGGAVPRPARPVTRFEQRARTAGRPVVDVVAVRL
jgi:tRNA (guanine-N7-)-methyltransferase